MWKTIKNTIKRFKPLAAFYDFLWRQKKKLKKSFHRKKDACKEQKEAFLLLWPIYRVKYFNRKTAFLVLSPDYDNIGDHAIAAAEVLLFQQNKIRFLEVPYQTCFFLMRKEKRVRKGL